MTGPRLRAEIHASVAEVEALCRRLRAELSMLGRADRFAVELLCREALANAAEHGCGFDPSKLISLEIDTVGDLIVARVHDDGEGFSRRPGSGDKLVERGKGIEIMEQYSDRLYFEDEGRTVVFERRAEKGSSE
jgi:serine/threonine-protein kinase RsbW